MLEKETYFTKSNFAGKKIILEHVLEFSITFIDVMALKIALFQALGSLKFGFDSEFSNCIVNANPNGTRNYGAN